MILFRRRLERPPLEARAEGHWRVPNASSDRELHWIQPRRFAGEWLLLAGSEQLGLLQRQGHFRGAWSFASGEGAFTILHDAWRSGASIRRVGEETALAQYRRKWLGRGAIEVDNGIRYLWCAPKWWSGVRELQTESGETRLHITPERGLIRYQGEVVLDAGARDLPHLTALLALTWWITLAGMSRRRHTH